jgi:egghead protein (zeste-white 4 protein)
MTGSITEDAFFALVAWKKGVKFSWIDANMFEQSPFSIVDFIYQRRRWFGGLWLICSDETTSLEWRYRFVLFVLVTTWKFSALPVIFIGVGNFFDFWNHSVAFATVTAWLVSFFSCVTCWSYLLGFVKTFDMNDGVVRYVVLLFVQLVMMPLFSVMEVVGVLAAVFFPPYDSFHIVKKEA